MTGAFKPCFKGIWASDFPENGQTVTPQTVTWNSPEIWGCSNDAWPYYFCESITIQVEAHRDINWWYRLLSAKRRAYFCKSIAIEMGGVLRYSSKVSGSIRFSWLKIAAFSATKLHSKEITSPFTNVDPACFYFMLTLSTLSVDAEWGVSTCAPAEARRWVFLVFCREVLREIWREFCLFKGPCRTKNTMV